MLLLQYKTKFDLIISCIIEILLLLVYLRINEKESRNYSSFAINASLNQHVGMLFEIILINACNNYKRLSQLILSNSRHKR